MNDVFGLDDAELDEIRQELHHHDVEFMSISGAEARILQFFIRACGVRKIVEVGTLFGYSTVAMAKALPEDGRIWTLEKNRTNFDVAAKHFAKFPVGKKIKSLNGDGLQLLASIESEGPFDMIFIDADKAGYVNYLNWAEKNIKRGGFIVGDNTFLFGALWDETRDRDIGEKQIAVMKEFNSRLADTSKYNSTLIPTVEGLTIAQKL